VILAHLSDLHLRDETDAVEFARQLDRIVARRVDHLAITGDLLDRWQPALLDRVLDILSERGLLSARSLTILHGNHDLVSSGGHPRQPGDLRRLALRFWDPPPVVAMRKRRFYRRIEERAPGVAGLSPFLKVLDGGVTLAVVDTVPAPWLPFSIGRGEVILNQGRGAISHRETDWIARLSPRETLVILTHHYPLQVSPYVWRTSSADPRSPSGWRAWLARWNVVVPMEIRTVDRERFWSAAAAAHATAVLCGHVHRTRVERYRDIAVCLNGQSGADWAGRTVAYYRVERGNIGAA
jgi:3',5'-cyclic AMP phosphodiesterase CpdA